MFEAQVSEGGNTAVVNLNVFPDAPMPFAIHLFGVEHIEKWNGSTEDSRGYTVQKVMHDVLVLATLLNLTDAQAASAYNAACAVDGIESHAIEYLGGGFDTV